MKRRRLCCLGTGRLALFFVAFFRGTRSEDLHIYMDGWDGWDCMTGTGDPATLHDGWGMGGVLWVGLVLPCRCAWGFKSMCLLMLDALREFGSPFCRHAALVLRWTARSMAWMEYLGEITQIRGGQVM